MGVPLLTLDEMLARARRGHARRRGRPGARAVAAGAPVGRRRGGGRGRRSARRSRRSARRSPQRRDQRRRLRRRGADGRDRLRARSRAPTTWRWSAAPTRSSRRALADVLGDADVVVDFSTPGHRARQRARLPRGGRALRDGHDRRRLLGSCEGVGRRQPVRGAQLRDRRGADDGVRRRSGAPHMPECEIVELHHDAQARRAVGHRQAHGRADRARPAGNVHEPIHSVRLPGPGGPPGGALRRPGPDAHDPPRLDRPRVVHARRAAGDPPGGLAGAARR